MRGRAAVAIACGGAVCVALLILAAVRAGDGGVTVGLQRMVVGASAGAEAQSATALGGGTSNGGVVTVDRLRQGTVDGGAPRGTSAEAGSQGRGVEPGYRGPAPSGRPVGVGSAAADPGALATGPVAHVADASSGGGAQGSRSAPYEPMPVIQAVRPQPGAGVRISHAVDVGFAFRPDHYRDGAMRVANESGRPLAISFHGGDCSGLRLNGQPVVEGRSYLVVGDAEIAGSSPVGVHVRQPSASDREPSPAGVG